MCTVKKLQMGAMAMAMSGVSPAKPSFFPGMIQYLQRLGMKLPINAGQLGRLPLCLIVALYLIPGAVGQYYADNGYSYKSYNCDKYCFADCQLGSEFSSCVNSKVHCNCTTKITLKNPFFMFVLCIGVVLLIAVCAAYCRYCDSEDGNSRRRSHVIVAQPVTGAPGSGAHIIANRSANNSQTRSSQTSPRTFVIPLGSQKSNDLPPEYLPPPSYNDCVVNVETTSEGHKY